MVRLQSQYEEVSYSYKFLDSPWLRIQGLFQALMFTTASAVFYGYCLFWLVRPKAPPW